jgi:hypothetical protein
LPEGSVVKEYLTTAADGKSYKTSFYNLDVIISVGYRVKPTDACSEHKTVQARILKYAQEIGWRYVPRA